MKNSFFQFPEKNLFFIISVCKVIKNSAPSKESAEKMVRVALFSGSVLLKEGHTAVHDTAFRDLRYAISWVLVRRIVKGPLPIDLVDFSESTFSRERQPMYIL